MRDEVLSRFDMTYLPTIGLLLFLFLFLSICYFAFKRQNKNRFDYEASIPLDDGETHGR